MTEANTAYRRQKNAQLAIVHIAKKDLGIDEEEYREILEKRFNVASAAALSPKELDRLIGLFKRWGFKTIAKPQKKTDGQAVALRIRAKNMAKLLPNGEKRLQGLVKKVCKTDRIEWCKDVAKLKSLLAALEKIKAVDLESANKK